MDLSPVEERILSRFRAKARLSGGPRPGYMLRERAIGYLDRDRDRDDLDYPQGLRALVEKGLLKVSDSGSLYYLTAAGAETLNARQD